MGTKGICVLLVNDDSACCNIVTEMLQSCTYEVLHIGKPLETLSTICERKDTINLVLTNLHRIQAQGTSDILHHIQKTLDLPTYLMSPDDEKIELKGQESSFAAYFLNSLDIGDINSLWEFASVNAIEETKATESKEEGSPQMDSSSQNIVTTSRENTPSSSQGNHSIRKHRKRKRRHKKEKSTEEGEASVDDEHSEKKPRVIWTDELHKKFLDAMEMILPEKPVPKKIVEVMNVPWLRRENVASHLQKYRIVVKRAEEKSSASKSGTFASSYHSALDFSSTQGNSHVTHLPYGKGMQHFQRGMSMAAPSNSTFHINARVPSSMSNLRPSSLLSSGSNQGSLQQLYNPNLSSSNASLMSQTNSYLPSANSQGSNRTGLPQMQLMNTSGFRVYGDQTRNMLLSDPGSNSLSDSTMTESSNKSFMGFRLTNEGKSLEFGQTSASVSNEIRTEMMYYSEISGGENQSLDPLRRPSTSANKIQVPPTTSVQQDGSSQNHNPENAYSSVSFDSISQLVQSLEDTVIHSPSVSVDPCTAMQHHPLPQGLITTTSNDKALHDPSRLVNNILPLQQQAFLPHFETPASWNLSIQSQQLPPSGSQQTSSVPSCPPTNNHSVQYPTTPLNSILEEQPQISAPPSENTILVHSSTMFASQQERNIVAFAENPGHGVSVKEASASMQKVMHHQESSIPSVSEELNHSWQDGNFSSFMNETGSSSPPSLWDGDFDDTFFNEIN